MFRYIVTPLIGALIGYCTNYIAVKMLFRPRREKYILGHRIPLTPGAVPKGKSRLARAVGEVISTYLVTDKDIESRALAGETEDAIVDRVMELLHADIDSGFRAATNSEEEYEALTGKLDDIVTERISDAVRSINFADIIKEKGGQIINEQLGGSMIGMFLNPETVSRLLGSISEVSINMEKLRRDNVYNIMTSTGVSDDELRAKIREIYRKTVRAVVPEVISKLDIAGMVRRKIDDMEVEQLEDMVMEVMRKELNTIVNLGALIGFLLGLINLIF